MADENTVYYIAAGTSLDAIQKWGEEVKAVKAKRRAFFDAMGTLEYWGTDDGDEVQGLVFPDGVEPPAGFRKVEKRRKWIWVPRLSIPEGKAIAEQLKELSMPRDFGVPGHWHGMSRYTPGVRTVGDKRIISHHKDAPPPIDAIPLKRSDYWAMVEADEAAKAVAA